MKIVDDHIVDNICDDVEDASMIPPSEGFNTLNKTVSNGTKKAVANNRIASVTKSKATHLTKGMLLCSAGSFEVFTSNRIAVKTKMKVSLAAVAVKNNLGISKLANVNLRI